MATNCLQTSRKNLAGRQTRREDASHCCTHCCKAHFLYPHELLIIFGRTQESSRTRRGESANDWHPSAFRYQGIYWSWLTGYCQLATGMIFVPERRAMRDYGTWSQNKAHNTKKQHSELEQPPRKCLNMKARLQPG